MRLAAVLVVAFAACSTTTRTLEGDGQVLEDAGELEDAGGDGNRDGHVLADAGDGQVLEDAGELVACDAAELVCSCGGFPCICKRRDSGEWLGICRP